MENRKPEFTIADQSVIHLITELHSYFRDLQSYYKIARGHLIGQLDEILDEAETKELHEQLLAVDKKIEYFQVLNNAISIADVVVHTETLVLEFNSPEN